MELLSVFREASIPGLFSMFVAIFPVFAGVAYLIAPSVRRLALLRPISLASLFSGLAGLMRGIINVLRGIWMAEVGRVDWRITAVGTAEAMVPLTLAFGALTFASLCIVVGMRRHRA